jgi:hypothetical protein
MRIGVLTGLRYVECDAQQGPGEDEDIEREIRELVQRYGMPPRS